MIRSFFAENPVLAVLAVSFFIVALQAGFMFWLFRRQKERMLRKLDDLLYKNSATGMHNIRWFKKNVPEMITGPLKNARDDGRLVIMAVSIQRLDLLKETYDEEVITSSIVQKIDTVRAHCPYIIEECISQELAVLYNISELTDGMTEREAAAKFLEEASSLNIGGLTIHLDYVVGIAPVPTDHKGDVTHIMHAASIAQSEASLRSEQIGIYDEKLQEMLILQRKMEDLMHKAIKNEEFKVWLQPKYDLITRRIVGAEALVRWDSPELGFLMPGKFIGLFERNGFAVNLDYYMLEQICKLQVKHQSMGHPILPISVNQSALHISEPGYLERMKTILIGYGLPPKAVDLELTETAFVDFNTKETRYVAKQIIHDLRDMGYATSMDDFCSGYSSISLLQNLPMETMKIDRALLIAAEKSPRAEIILKGVVALGQALNMNVICEGIETKEQEELLIKNGCRHGQGYLFAKPMPLDEFESFVARIEEAAKSENE